MSFDRTFFEGRARGRAAIVGEFLGDIESSPSSSAFLFRFVMVWRGETGLVAKKEILLRNGSALQLTGKRNSRARVGENFSIRLTECCFAPKEATATNRLG